ncbi:MAG: Gfo/Idh/MocA family protein [Thermoanaerobaculia bacterium]
MIRAGAIGAGMVFGHYARAAAEVPEIRIVAIFDPDPARPRTHDDLEAFFREPLDAVLVLAPNAAHPALVEQCLERGLPTMCEKPLATTGTEARALLDRAAERATLLYPAMHTRHRPEIRYFADHVDAPIAEFAQVWLEDWSRGPAWYFRPEDSGGGVLLDVGINHIDWIARHVGALEIDEVRTAEIAPAVERECEISWTFAGGTGRSHFSWRGSPEHRRADIRTMSGSRFELHHDTNSVVHDGRAHGPWRNDEYARVLREFVREIADPATRAPSPAADILALIGRAYARMGAVPERSAS